MAKQNRRGELELLDDRHKLSQLALTNPGASSKDLSDMFLAKYGRRIPARTIRYDLQKLREQWLKETKENVGIMRAQELARVDTLEQQAWQAWRASMKPFEKVVVEKLHRGVNDAVRAELAGKLAGELADKNKYITHEVLETIIREAMEDSLDSGEDSDTFVNKITETTEVRIGDPRYLSQIHSIQQERRKILGVYAPELHQVDVRKIELKGYAGGFSPDDWRDDDIIDGDMEEEGKRAKELMSGDSDEEQG